MTERKIKSIFKAKPTLEGAGVKLHRGFGYGEVPLFDPFLLLDDFGSDNPRDYLAGFPWHPHRGIETVTYIIKGEVDHEDSLGNKGAIKDGDVQWMTAGSGIIHQEMPRFYDGSTKGFQLWVNLPRKHKMTNPRYRGIGNSEIPVVREDKASVKVVTGNYRGISGPVTELTVPVFYFDVSLDAGGTWNHEIPADFNVFLYVFEGIISLGGSAVPGEHFVVLTSGGRQMTVRAGNATARFLVVGGEPLGEPVVWRGPIVMNTEKEITEAFAEYHNGMFVKNS